MWELRFVELASKAIQTWMKILLFEAQKFCETFFLENFLFSLVQFVES